MSLGVLDQGFLDAAASFKPRPAQARRTGWAAQARPDQLPPVGDWMTWLLRAGRGSGKTRAAVEWIADMARTHPGARIALVAATFADGRDTMVEGESGLLAVLDDAELRGGNRDSAWNRSMGELFLSNGCSLKVFSSEKPSRLRGPQHHFAWCDEAAQFLDAHKGTAKDTTWSNLLFGLRLKARPDWPAGYRPRVVVSTTPRPVALLKVPQSVLATEPHRAGIEQRPSTVVTLARTHDNLANLSASYRETVVDPLTGTTLGRQELDGEYIEDLEGAFLTRSLVESLHVRVGEMPYLVARVVAVDPATTAGQSSDETGIVALGIDADGDLYVLADYTTKGSPDHWARVVWGAALEQRAHAVVVEDNAGGDMVQHVLATTWQAMATEPGCRGLNYVPALQRVHPAGRDSGKWARAQAVRVLYEQRKIHHVVNRPTAPEPAVEGGPRVSPDWDRVFGGASTTAGQPPAADPRLVRLEDQLCSWTGDPKEDSPDRIDALVHGAMWLRWGSEQRATPARHLHPVRGQRWAAGGRAR